MRLLKFKNIKYGDIANEINDKKFVLPRKHNEENKITRFFKVAFLSEEEFLAIKSFNYYFESNYCDGLVIYLLRENLDSEAIKAKLNEINDKRVVVKYPKEKVSKIFYKSLLMFFIELSKHWNPFASLKSLITSILSSL